MTKREPDPLYNAELFWSAVGLFVFMTFWAIITPFVWLYKRITRQS